MRWLRTSRHPSAGAVPGARSFDYLYESAESLDEVYAGIVEALVSSAQAEGASSTRSLARPWSLSAPWSCCVTTTG